MAAPKPVLPEFRIGSFVCPKTQNLAPLWSSLPLAAVDWPLVVEACPDCGEQHILHAEEVLHPPAFGYE